jgi:hypothetical protein
MDSLTDEIESILFIAREVMGESLYAWRSHSTTCRWPAQSLAKLIHVARPSLPGPTSNKCIGIQGRGLERRGFHLEGTTAGS